MRKRSKNAYLYMGGGILVVLVVLYVLAVFMGWASARYIGLEFVAGAFVDMLVIPRLTPITYTKYDDNTPTTSRIFGSVITQTGTVYFIIEIILAAIFIKRNSDPLLRVLYIQAAVMIVYLSIVAFLVDNPSESELAQEMAKTTGSAGGGEVVSTERRDRMIKELKKSRAKAYNDEQRSMIDEVLDELTKSPSTSYQSMDESDQQLAGLIGELGIRLDEHNDDMARECLQLCTVVIEQRNTLYQKTNKRSHKSNSKAASKPASASAKGEEQEERHSGVRGRQGARIRKPGSRK